MSEVAKEIDKRCPCGGVIFADTEDWETPLCYECYEKKELEYQGEE